MRSFIRFFNSLKSQRYFSIIIHSAPGTGLSRFASRAADQLNADYINLQDLFLNDHEFKNKIPGFSYEDLLSFLKLRVKSGKPIFLDKVDFLIDTWREDNLKALLNLLRRQWDTSSKTFNVPLVVFVESAPWLEGINIKFSDGGSKIFKLSQFNAL